MLHIDYPIKNKDYCIVCKEWQMINIQYIDPNKASIVWLLNFRMFLMGIREYMFGY